MHFADWMHNRSMDELDNIQVFLAVAELDSFSGAARRLGLPNATVSAAVRRLEQELGVRLLQRTTRRVQMTQEGEAFYARSRALLEEFEDLRAMFRQGADSLAGRLRVDMSVGMAVSVVLPRLDEFLARHPRLQVDLGTADRRVDIVREGYDCVLRAGVLADSSLVARPLGSYRMINCAAPAYLERYGTPHALVDLPDHRIVHYDAQLAGGSPAWEWFDGRVTHRAPVGAALTVNGTAAYAAACVAGLGIAQIPEAGVRDRLAAGALVEVMPDFRPAPMPVSFVYPSRRHVPARAAAFMDWVAALLAPWLVAARDGSQGAPGERTLRGR
jgi:DNA-binding transcriptional LysR family regulator